MILHRQLSASLLAEMASGFYIPNQRFLSNRKICRLWDVSETTAKASLAWLVREGLLAVRPRSGYYFRTDARKRALSRIHDQPPALPLAPTWNFRRYRLRLRSRRRPLEISVILSLQVPAALAKTGKPLSIEPHAQPEYTGRLFQEIVAHGGNPRFYVDDGRAALRQQIIDRILGQGTDGVVAFRRHASYVPLRPLVAPLLDTHLPVVTVFDDCEGTQAVSLNINNIGMGVDVTRRLLKLGHRRIAVLVPTRRNAYFDDRAEGCRMALARIQDSKAHLDIFRFSPFHLLPTQIARKFRDPVCRPTALFATTTALLSPLWPLLRALRLRVPRDLSIIMCAGGPRAPEVNHRFDVMRIDFAQIGVMAFTRLMELLEGRVGRRSQWIQVGYLPQGTTRALG